MPYRIKLSVLEIAKSTLYLMENSEYEGSDGVGINGKHVNDLKGCLQAFLAGYKPNQTSETNIVPKYTRRLCRGVATEHKVHKG